METATARQVSSSDESDSSSSGDSSSESDADIAGPSSATKRLKPSAAAAPLSSAALVSMPISQVPSKRPRVIAEQFGADPATTIPKTGLRPISIPFGIKGSPTVEICEDTATGGCDFMYPDVWKTFKNKLETFLSKPKAKKRGNAKPDSPFLYTCNLVTDPVLIGRVVHYAYDLAGEKSTAAWKALATHDRTVYNIMQMVALSYWIVLDTGAEQLLSILTSDFTFEDQRVYQLLTLKPMRKYIWTARLLLLLTLVLAS